MILHILRKELLVNLLSMRFLVGLIVSVLMMGIVGYVLVEDYAARYQTYLSNLQVHEQALAHTKVYSMVQWVVDIPPSPLSVFSRQTKDLPTSIHVSPYHIPSLIDEGEGSGTIDLSGTGNRPYNPLLKIFTSIDLSFVISVILSLFAVLLIFDSFSGEHEQGTMKLLLSSSTGRVHLVIGKFLGALLTLAIPLTIGFLEVMILWILHPGLSLNASAWAGAGLIYFFSLVFLSSFLALALFLSLYAKESSSCLMYLLLGWVVVAILIPQGAEYAAEFLRPADLREKMLGDADQARTAYLKSYSDFEYRQKSGWNNVSIDPFGGEQMLGITQEEAYNRVEFTRKILPLKFRFAEERYRVVESYASALTRWSNIRDNLTRPSLCVLYGNIVQAIAGTNVSGFDDAVRYARFYRGAMMAYLGPKMSTPEWFTRVFEYPDLQPTDRNMKYWQSLIEKQGERAVEKILSWDRIAPLDLGSMPPPHFDVSSPAERMGSAMIDGMVLMGCTALFLCLSIWRIGRYPAI